MRCLRVGQPLVPRTCVSGFGVRGSGFGFRGSVFRFLVSGLGFRVFGFGVRFSGFGLAHSELRRKFRELTVGCEGSVGS